MSTDTERNYFAIMLKTLGILLSVIIILPLFGNFISVFIEFSTYLLFGWIMFLKRVFPAITWDWESIGVGVGSFILLAFLLHPLCRWLYAEQQRLKTSATERIPETQPWQKRWTAAILGLTLLLFTTGIAIVGFVHQVIWLYRK